MKHFLVKFSDELRGIFPKKSECEFYCEYYWKWLLSFLIATLMVALSVAILTFVLSLVWLYLEAWGAWFKLDWSKLEHMQRRAIFASSVLSFGFAIAAIGFYFKSKNITMRDLMKKHCKRIPKKSAGGKEK